MKSMSAASFFNVLDSRNWEWLTADGKWSKRYGDTEKFESWGSAIAKAKACDPQGERTPAVLKMGRPTVADLQKQCDDFNAKHSIGTSVTLRTDTKGDIATKTRSAAEVLGNNSAVVRVEGISGCWALDRVTVG